MELNMATTRLAIREPNMSQIGYHGAKHGYNSIGYQGAKHEPTRLAIMELNMATTRLAIREPNMSYNSIGYHGAKHGYNSIGYQGAKHELQLDWLSGSQTWLQLDWLSGSQTWLQLDWLSGSQTWLQLDWLSGSQTVQLASLPYQGSLQFRQELAKCIAIECKCGLPWFMHVYILKQIAMPTIMRLLFDKMLQ